MADASQNNPLVFSDPMGRNALTEYGQIVKSVALQLIKRHWKCLTTVVVMGAAGATAYYEVGEGLSYLAGGAFAASTFEFLAKVIAPNWVDPFSKAKEGAAKLTRAVIKRVCF